MKQKLRLIMMTLLCAVFSSAWAVEVTDVLTRETTGVTGTSYASWSDVRVTSNAVYAGQSAGGNESIQLRSNNNNSGITTTTSGGKVKSITVTWNSNTAEGRTLNIYGSNTAYTNPTELYSENTQGTLLGTIVNGKSTSLTVEGDYSFIGIRSNSGAMYLDQIEITWESASAPAISAPTFEPAGGSTLFNNQQDDEARTVRISCEDEEANIYYTTDGSTPTSISTLYTDDGVVISNTIGTTTIKAIAIKGSDESQVVSAEYKVINSDLILADFAELYSKDGDGNYILGIKYVDLYGQEERFGKGAVVTYVNGNNAYLYDGSGAILLYKNGHGLHAGDILNYMAEVDFKTYDDLPEITDIKYYKKGDTSETPQPIGQKLSEFADMDEDGFAIILSMYYKITEAAITQEDSKYYIQMGRNKVQLIGKGEAQNFSINDFENTYTIIGFPSINKGVKQLVIFEKPVGKQKVDPELSFDQTELTVTISDTGIKWPILDNQYNVAVTYSSSKESVATVDPNSGAVTIKNAGTTTITATSEANATYSVGSASYKLIVSDNSGIGTTPEKAYTVEQARDAIDNEANVTDVYAKGIVSKVIKFDNGYLTYNISDDGEESSPQLQAYHGKGVGGGNFTSKDDIQMGDVVVIKGNLTLYNNSTYEFAADNQLVSLERPQTPIISAKTSINLAYDAISGEIEYTIVNPKEGTTLTANTEADWISNITVTNEKVTFTTTANEGGDDRTATISLSYDGAESVTVEVTQGHYVADYATLPFEFNGGQADIRNTDGLTQEGIDSKDYSAAPKLKFNNTGDWLILKFNERPGVLKYTIKGNSFSGGTFTVQTSEDGETYTNLTTYTEFGSSGNESLQEVFNNLGENVRYIKWIYTEKAEGEGKGGNVGVGVISLNKYINLQNPELSFEKSTYTANLDEGFAAPTLINPHELTVAYTSSEATVATVNEENGAIELVGAGTTIITATFNGDDTYTEGSASYTLTVTKPETPPIGNDDVFVLANNLFPGDQIIIVNVNEESGTEASTTYMGLGEQRDNNRAAIEVEANENGTLNGNDNLSIITLKAATTENTWWLYDGEGYLYAAGGNTANYLRRENEPDADGKADAAITISDDGTATIVFQDENTIRNTLRYNSSNKPPIFSCYAEKNSQKDVKIYRKKATLLGDANNDGIVNVTDVMMVVRYTLNGGDGLDINLRNADINEDGQVNITDAMAIIPLAI